MTVIDIARPGRGWQIRGLDRGAGTPPEPPAPAFVKGLIDRQQAEVLAANGACCDALDASRAEGARLRGQLDRARQAALDAQQRYTDACLRACADQLGRVWRALGSPELQVALVGKAWTELADGKRDPASVRLAVERVCWALR